MVVFADWFSTETIVKQNFYDESSFKFWNTVTGGSNIPAMNRLLSKFGISFGNTVFSGEQFNFGKEKVAFSSGNTITTFPGDSYLVFNSISFHILFRYLQKLI